MIVRKVKEEEKAFIEDFVLEIFRDSTPYSDGVLEKALVKEIRENKYYIPEFDLVAEEDGKIVGHYMMSKFPISGKYKEEMLIMLAIFLSYILLQFLIKEEELGHIGLKKDWS